MQFGVARHRRNRLELYHDILAAIKLDMNDGVARPTRVQSKTNLAYDKLTRYLGELESKGMITREPLALAEKGHEFLKDYARIKGFLDEMGVKYLTRTRRVSR